MLVLYVQQQHQQPSMKKSADAKKPNRFSPHTQKPWRKWYWIVDESQNTFDAWPLNQDWPPENEIVTDQTLNLAIAHRRIDIIARYFRQPNPSREALNRLASLFDWSKDGAEPDGLEFTKRRNSHRTLKERTERHRLQIGGEIFCLVATGTPHKRAIHAVSAKYGIARSSALNALKFYKKDRATS
jgi:hypothetical protein